VVDGSDRSSLSGCSSHDPLESHFRALHRRLWILNATLETLPRKIEEIAQTKGCECIRKSAGPPSGPSERSPSPNPAPSGQTPVGGSAIERWRARRRRAHLKLRAELADRRAASAIEAASVSFTRALEAVLLAAAARIKAEEAGR
jgi:hypothetical protein